MLTAIGFFFQAPRPSCGPHKMRECLPLSIFLRNRLKYALTYDEAKKILNQRLVKVDGKIRSDKTYPAGFMGKLTFIICQHSLSASSWKLKSFLLNKPSLQYLKTNRTSGFPGQKKILIRRKIIASRLMYNIHYSFSSTFFVCDFNKYTLNLNKCQQASL